MNLTSFQMVLLGCSVTALATSLGALPALIARKLSKKIQNFLSGLSSGIMLAATAFSLILPSLNLMETSSESKIIGTFYVSISILFGALLLHLLNTFLPHEHFFSDSKTLVSKERLKKIWLFVAAIAIHNFPEGLAVGTGIGSMDWGIALPILVGIGLQDIPEGFVVAVALISAGYKMTQALFVSVLTGVIEALATLVGHFAMVEMQAFLPWALSLSGGAMLYVVSSEMIPESHQSENPSAATAGLMLGFVIMMFLDSALGQ